MLTQIKVTLEETHQVYASLPLNLADCRPQRHHSMPLSAKLDGLVKREDVTDTHFHRSSQQGSHHGAGALLEPVQT